jgi:glycosyltransferase 2 family protein
MTPVEPRTSSQRRWMISAFRIGVLLLVYFGVRGTVTNAVERLAQYEWQVRPGWILLAGALYVLGLVPMAWFWWRSLAALNQPAPWSATLRAYFFGHLGKYVPGKALAVIMRVTAITRWVTSIRIAIITSLLETLTMMAVGGFLAALLSAMVLQLEWTLTLLAFAMAAACLVPTLPPISRWLSRIGAFRLKTPIRTNGKETASQPSTNIDSHFEGLSWPLLASGWIAAAVCWILLGLSLAATLRAIGVDNVEPLRQLPLLVAAVSFAVVSGFASMLPGGVGVRDLLLMQLLAPYVGDANALIAAVLVRLVWLVSELCVCVILYVGAKLRQSRS